MTKLITILLSLTICINAGGQKNIPIRIVHKQLKYKVAKGCYDEIKWDEVSLSNKNISRKINAAIRRSIASYKLQYGNSQPCDDENFFYNRKCKVVYTKNNIISYLVETDLYYTGILHDFHELSTLNFEAGTGKQISYFDLIDESKLHQVDSLLLKAVSKKSDQPVSMADYFIPPSEVRFNFRQKGIVFFYFNGPYPYSTFLTCKELVPCLKKQCITVWRLILKSKTPKSKS